MIWTAERNRAQGALVAALYSRAATVPCERRAVMAGGLPGADTSAALASAGVDRSRYLTISLDGIKEEMAARELIPRVEGLSPMEASELVHAESAWLAKRLGLRAIADGRNVLWDITMASAAVVQSWLDVLQRGNYTVEGIFADISVEESVRRAAASYRRKHEDYLNGQGYGGRYVPPEAIRALADERRSGSSRETHQEAPGESGRQEGRESGGQAGRESGGQAGRQPDQEAGQSPMSASDEVTRPIDGYAAGELTLEELAQWFRVRRWPDVPRAWPPGLERAAPAIDDPEPYVPGSFDDVVLAYDRRQLSDLEYEILASAATAARRAEDDGDL